MTVTVTLIFYHFMFNGNSTFLSCFFINLMSNFNTEVHTVLVPKDLTVKWVSGRYRRLQSPCTELSIIFQNAHVSGLFHEILFHVYIH